MKHTFKKHIFNPLPSNGLCRACGQPADRACHNLATNAIHPFKARTGFPLTCHYCDMAPGHRNHQVEEAPHPHEFNPNPEASYLCNECGLGPEHSIHSVKHPDTQLGLHPHHFLSQLGSPNCVTCPHPREHIIHNMPHHMTKMPHVFQPQRGKNNLKCVKCAMLPNHPIHIEPLPFKSTVPLDEEMGASGPAQPGIPYYPRGEREVTMLDMVGSEIVQVQVSTNPDSTETLWVNVDGICRLRICRPQQIMISDERKK